MEPTEQILQIASQSEIARHSWNDRGRAPPGYIKGMALVYARTYCRLQAGDAFALEMAKANTGDGARDALAWYDEAFAAQGMRNDNAGADTLRHLFTLLIGLGMRESSGRHCCGRDTSASNTTANTAEAGLFQTSFNARSASPLMPALFAEYSRNPAGFVEVFREGVRCSAADLQNFGDGDGMAFQALSKNSPAFAAEFAAIGLRNIRQHWGPINRRAAELRAECDAMLQQVQTIVDAAPDVCTVLRSGSVPPGGSVPAGTPPTLRRGMAGDDVRRLQEALRQRGLLAAVDGVFGPQTEAAVRRFQADNGLVADGVVGPASWAKLA